MVINSLFSQAVESYNIYLKDTINITDVNGMKQGRWIYFGKDRKEKKYKNYKENQIIEEGHFKNNVKVGIWKTYHNNSKLQSDIFHNDNHDFNFAKFYNEDGNLIAEGNIRENKFIGDYTVFDMFGNKQKKNVEKTKNVAKLVFSGTVEKFGDGLDNVTIVIERNGVDVNKLITNKNGAFELNLDLNFEYIIHFSKENFNDQSIIINTNVYDINDTAVYYLKDWTVQLNDNLANSLRSDFIGLLLNKPSGKIYFNKKKNEFTSDGAYLSLFNKQLRGIKKSTKFLIAQVANDNKRLELENLRIESEKKMNEINLLRQTQELKEAEIKKKEAEILAQKLEKEKNEKDLSIAQQEKRIKDLKFDQQKAILEKQMLQAERNAKEIEHLAMLKKIQELELKEKQTALTKTNEDLALSVAENIKRGKELDLAKREKKIKEHELKQKMFYFYILAGGLILVCLFALFVFRSFRQKKKANILLEKQSVEILAQKSEIEQKSLLLEQKNIETEQSIQYAKRIQHAILPPHSEIAKYLKNYFILYKSKDIVSGDFYFFSDKHAKDGIIHIASVDCTGHGVPGAFMSVIGHEKLNDAVSVAKEPSDILTELNKGVKAALRQSSDSSSTRDGMDLVLCSLPANLDSNQIQIKYSGANRPLWIVRDKVETIEEIKATKLAIGGFTEDKQEFEQHEVNLSKGDTIYLFSDGYADQFGGVKKKKLMTGKFKDLILSIQHMSLADQKDYLNNFIEDWMDGLEQIDDILVIGIKL